MRIYIDEDVNPRIARFLPGHTFDTPNSMGWKGLKNGQLLARLNDEFSGLISHDGNIEFQQNLSKSRIWVIVLEMEGRQLADYEAIAPEVVQALKKIKPRTCMRVRLRPVS